VEEGTSGGAPGDGGVEAETLPQHASRGGARLPEDAEIRGRRWRLGAGAVGRCGGGTHE
jgi:hypothetical protein